MTSPFSSVSIVGFEEVNVSWLVYPVVKLEVYLVPFKRSMMELLQK